MNVISKFYALAAKLITFLCDIVVIKPGRKLLIGINSKRGNFNFNVLTSSVWDPVQTSTDYVPNFFSSFSNRNLIACWLNDFFS